MKHNFINGTRPVTHKLSVHYEYHSLDLFKNEYNPNNHFKNVVVGSIHFEIRFSVNQENNLLSDMEIHSSYIETYLMSKIINPYLTRESPLTNILVNELHQRNGLNKKNQNHHWKCIHKKKTTHKLHHST